MTISKQQMLTWTCSWNRLECHVFRFIEYFKEVGVFIWGKWTYWQVYMHVNAFDSDVHPKYQC